MKTPLSSLLSLAFVLFSISFSWATSYHTHKNFLQCLSLFSQDPSISKVVYTPSNSTYSSVFDFSAQNPRFLSNETLKPQVIVTPLHESHIQAAISCSKKHGMQIRVRSGGHDYEGLSYVSEVPFVIVDLINLRSVTVNVKNKTAWVEAGATIGELYYGIAEKSKTLAFTAGICPTVGVGGHFSGGGYGALSRKYGLAVDHIIDARLITADGRILVRKNMGEDLFWAIRGGGGGNFGVVVAWKIKLVSVPSTVTVFSVDRIQNATKLVHRWQYVTDKFPKDLSMGVELGIINSTQEGKTTIRAQFRSLFLGGVDKLLSTVQETFPELGLVKEECIEMSWIESVPYFARFPSGASIDVLLNRTQLIKRSFKIKSDYVTKPMPVEAIEGIWERLHGEETGLGQTIFFPYGGRMSEISGSATPFPHRAGNIYKIQYLVFWDGEGIAPSQRHLDWIRGLYDSLTPYVSKSPRGAYVNDRDLDIGRNNIGYTSYKQASIWGIKYFNKNFKRLVRVKTMVDPANFFRNEQSIPSLSPQSKKNGE